MRVLIVQSYMQVASITDLSEIQDCCIVTRRIRKRHCTKFILFVCCYGARQEQNKDSLNCHSTILCSQETWSDRYIDLSGRHCFLLVVEQLSVNVRHAQSIPTREDCFPSCSPDGVAYSALLPIAFTDAWHVAVAVAAAAASFQFPHRRQQLKPSGRISAAQ